MSTPQTVDESFRIQKRRILGAAAIAIVVLVVLYFVTRPEPPGRKDFDVSVFKAYPGSTLSSEDFQKADSGRTIDMEKFSDPSRLRRIYKLQAPVSLVQFDDWIERSYPPFDWNTKGSSTQLGWHNYGVKKGNRFHSLEVVALE